MYQSWPQKIQAVLTLTRKRRLYLNHRNTDPRLNWHAFLTHYNSFPKIQHARERPGPQASCFFFTFGGSTLGLPPSNDTITRWVSEIMFRAGIPTEFSHSVRGSVVTQKVREGYLDELTGIFHSPTTQKRYYDRSDVPAITRQEGAVLRESRQHQKWTFRKPPTPDALPSSSDSE